MTETSTLTVYLTEIEPEFDQPCQMFIPPENCLHPATFMMWTTHTTSLGCPTTLYVCDRCMQFAIERVAIALKRHGKCTTCGQPLTGLITDNVRFIKL